MFLIGFSWGLFFQDHGMVYNHLFVIFPCIKSLKYFYLVCTGFNYYWPKLAFCEKDQLNYGAKAIWLSKMFALQDKNQI